MSRKHIADVAENIPLTADIGPVLKLMGDVFTKQWQTNNGIHLNKEERKDRGKKPIAEVQNSDIQIRVGNQLFTLAPSEEGKAMVSIPVGMSDKATPAIIPKEWMIGMHIDVMIDMCEGDTTLAYKWAEGMNAAINNAMQVNDDGKVKIDQSLLPDLRHPIAVGEIMNSYKRTFLSQSAGSAKLHFTIDVQELEQVEEEVEIIEYAPSTPAELLTQRANEMLADNSTLKEEQVVGEESQPFTKPEPASIEVASPQPNDVEEVVAVVADPTPPVDEIKIHIESDLEYAERIAKENEIVENPHNFKKQPTAWIKHQLAADYFNAEITINDVAELAGCHVQTIKRALEQFEAEADYTHIAEDFPDCDDASWDELGISLNDTHRLLITCERSPTGRYARGRPIRFIIKPKEDLPFDGPTVDDDAPVLKEADDTDPSLHACPDCGTSISKEQAVDDAPDWICEECHAHRMMEDEEWAEQTNERSAQRAIYEAKPIENVPTITDNPIPLEALIDDEPEYAPEQTDAEIEADYAMIEAIESGTTYERDFTPVPDSVPDSVLEGVVKAVSKGGCDNNCDAPVSFKSMTSIGERGFCTEKCWAEYVGEPVKPEGHYGLQAAYDEEVELQSTESSPLDGFNFSNAMGF